MPVYVAQECPVCREAAATSFASNIASQHHKIFPVDDRATHVLVPPLTKSPLELYGGIEDDEYLDRLRDNLVEQFSPFIGAFACLALTFFLVGGGI